MARRSNERVTQLLNGRLDDQHFVFHLLRKICQGISTDFSHHVDKLVVDEDWRSITHLHVDPAGYTCGDAYFADKVVEAFARKYPFPGFDSQCTTAAHDTFVDCETTCASTNDRLKRWNAGRTCAPLHADSVLDSARWKISRVLGRLDVSRWLDSCKFGPGASTEVPGTSDYSKLRSSPSCTEELLPFVGPLLAEYPVWVDALTYTVGETVDVSVTQGGKHTFVPKDAKTHRNIEIQPLLNSWLQSGLGVMIRRRLKRLAGIDLNDQTRNQELARQGSITGFWATIDLSNASDTIASNLVRLLLPDDWLHAMELTRTHKVWFDGGWRKLHRFSSMGNAFTFELESLIFWAICKSICEVVHGYEGDISVYGDDIIIPAHCFETICEFLPFFGFTPNLKKSFHVGPFRESCGTDWWNGVNVRPLFLKDKPRNVADVISLANGLRRVASRLNRGYGYDRRLASAWFAAIRRVPPAIRRCLAFGYTEDNDMVLAGNPRHGKVLIFIATKQFDLNWYPAKAVALYRLWRRSGMYSGEPDPCERSLPWWQRIDSQPGDGQIFDYARDRGRWALKSAEGRLIASPLLLDDWV